MDIMIFLWGMVAGVCVFAVVETAKNAWEKRDVSLTKQLRSMDSDICKLMGSRDIIKTMLDDDRRTIKILEKEVLALANCVDFKKYQQEMNKIEELEKRFDDERNK